MISRTLVDPDYVTVASAIQQARLSDAEPVLNALVNREPGNPLVLFQAGEFEFSRQNQADACKWYERALKIAPGYLPALYGLARCKGHFGEFGEALAVTERMLSVDPANVPARLYRASVCNRLGDHDAAIELCRGVLMERPGHIQALHELGQGHRAAGNRDEAVKVFREIIRVAPRAGDPWYQLADLKTYRISDEDIAAMTALRGTKMTPPGDVLLEYALGKAWYDRKDYARAHEHYLAGNLMARDPAIAERRIAKFRRWIRDSADAFADIARAGAGIAEQPRPDRPQPIFIVGMPRVGSTLIEQILASHPLIEATDELPHMEAIAHELTQGTAPLSALNRKAMAERYLRRAGLQRRQGRPWFIDKLPHNYRNVALIKALFPGSRIIDDRRHPLASTAAIFRQSFTNALIEYSGSLEQIAELRRDYAQDMEMFDQAMPGAVLRIYYEHLVEDVENEVRRMLDFIGVPFDEACLRWYERKGAVRTPSSEQVRQPIYRSALEEWRNFDPWLDHAKSILSDELLRYPAG